MTVAYSPVASFSLSYPQNHPAGERLIVISSSRVKGMYGK